MSAHPPRDGHVDRAVLDGFGFGVQPGNGRAVDGTSVGSCAPHTPRFWLAVSTGTTRSPSTSVTGTETVSAHLLSPGTQMAQIPTVHHQRHCAVGEFDSHLGRVAAPDDQLDVPALQSLGCGGQALEQESIVPLGGLRVVVHESKAHHEPGVEPIGLGDGELEGRIEVGSDRRLASSRARSRRRWIRVGQKVDASRMYRRHRESSVGRRLSPQRSQRRIRRPDGEAGWYASGPLAYCLILEE